MLTVAAVARRLGVAPSTLRTWDRRYDLGPSAHTAGSHRRYGPHDLARLVVMRRLTLEGVPPAEAARIALATPLDAPVAGGGHPPAGPGAVAGRHLPSSTDDPASRAPDAAGATAAAPEAEADDEDGVQDPRPGPPGDSQAVRMTGAAALPPVNQPPHREPAEPWRPPAIPAARSRTAELDPGLWRRDSTVRGDVPASWPLPSGAPAARGGLRNGGGRVVALPDGSPAARGLARAAMSLDSAEVQRRQGAGRARGLADDGDARAAVDRRTLARDR
jgi:MerR family transcriptional regulator, light-induced transcriptional regulator